MFGVKANYTLSCRERRETLQKYCDTKHTQDTEQQFGDYTSVVPCRIKPGGGRLNNCDNRAIVNSMTFYDEKAKLD